MSTEDYRIEFLQRSRKLTPEQRKRCIHKLDIIELAIQFGVPIAVQLQRDAWAGFKAWDSFSMICQSEALLPSEEEVLRFKEWATKQLEKRWYTE